MKQVLILILMFFYLPSFSQVPKTIASVWYGKYLAFEFQQDGTAKIFARKTLVNWTTKLEIARTGNYRFIVRGEGDIDTISGKVSIKGDTISFITKSRADEIFTERYLTYALTKKIFVYSNNRILASPSSNSPDSRFTKVETPSSFKSGNDALLSIIYTQLHSPKDSVFLNSYKFSVDSFGVAMPETIVRVEGEQDYTRQLQKILRDHQTEFVPATQNGKPVQSYMFLKFSL